MSEFRPTAEQERIIQHRGSPLQVIACAGSGKTESISRRVAQLIADGASPDSIIAFTFTEKAAAELKERIYDRVEEVKGSDFLGRLGPMFVGTIHGYCFHLLQDHVPRFGNYDVLDEHRHVALVSRCRHEIGLSKLHNQTWESIDLFLRAVEVVENELIPTAAIAASDLGACYAAYRELLGRYRFLTFGMIIAQAVEALEADPTVFQRVHDPLQHLIVDEYQDINPAQQRLIELLARDPVELCVVGDDDQSIYQWRGADVGNILGFEARHQNVHAEKLEANRRSRPTIVATANHFAQSIPKRLAKEMRAVREAGETEFVTWLADTPQREADVIAEQIKRLRAQGWQYRSIAVLFRSVRTSAPPLVAALQQRGIPFSCGGRTGLFAQPEINCIGELFSWMADFSWRDARFGPSRDADLEHVLDGLMPAFGIPDDQRIEIRRYFEDWKKWHKRGNRRVSLVGDFFRHLRTLGVARIDPDSPEGPARLGAFARFSKVLADYESVTLRSRWVTNAEGKREWRSGLDRGREFWRGLASYLVHYAHDAYEDFEGEEIHDLDAVSILTVHQAKGLEWPVLFLPALSDQRFPSSMSGRSQQWVLPGAVFPSDKRVRYEGSDADERRLFYVAITRARDILYASSFKRLTRDVHPSPYLVEIAAANGASTIPSLTELPFPAEAGRGKSDEPSPLELGYSDLADYEECGFAYRLSRILGFERELATELGYGRAVHHVLRHVAQQARTLGRVPSRAEIEALVRQELYVPFANESTFANMIRNVRHLVERYVNEWPSDLQRIWATERPFEVHLEGGLLAGRADVILDEEGGQAGSLAIVDYKAAADPHRDERYARQLAIYAEAGRQEGLDVKACYLHELRDSQRRLVDTSPEITTQVIGWANLRVGEIRSGSCPAQPSEAKCTQCDYRLICRHSCVPDEL